MSELAHTDEVVTKEYLANFYQEILPYLGSSLIVKTGASDYLSTDEKIVGVFIDGKPLYQKSFVYPNISITGTQQNIGDISGMNIEFCEVVRSCVNENGYWANPGVLCVWARVPENNFGVKVVDGVTRNGTLYFTIQYTKTTDAASSATGIVGSYDIARPDTWPENTEIFFGNGLYGYRVTGTKLMSQTSAVSLGITATSIVDEGGQIYFPGWVITPCPFGWGDAAYAMLFVSSTNELMFNAFCTGMPSVTEAQYNIWVTYKK